MSGEGRGSDSPYVPDYADDDGDDPPPAPAALRFRAFRVAFGRAVAGRGSLGTALGTYARRATGGASTGPRRFRPAWRAAGALFAVLDELRAGGTGETAAGTGLPALVGRPVGEACEAIAQALAPRNGDADSIRIALQEALWEALAGGPAPKRERSLSRTGASCAPVGGAGRPPPRVPAPKRERLWSPVLRGIATA